MPTSIPSSVPESQVPANCQSLSDDLSQLLELPRPRAIVDHLAQCEACRDLCFELESQVARVTALADRYVHPADFVERVLGNAKAPTLSEPSREQPHRLAIQSKGTRDRLGLTLSLCAAAIVLLVLAKLPPRGSVQTNVMAPSGAQPQAIVGAWRAVLKAVHGGPAEGAAVLACDVHSADSCQPLVVGAPLPPDSPIRTAANTRAELAFDDGTTVHLDAQTELVVSSVVGRELSLRRGRLVAEVVPAPDQRALFRLPRGHVEVLGTKFALQTNQADDWVFVTRGAVRLVDEQGRSVDVHAGASGHLHAGALPVAEPAPGLAHALSWADEGERHAAPELVPPGLGELRASRPGSDHEEKNSVELTRQSLRVRIANGMARTEVRQDFTNLTHEVLEGIYRFSIPPDASVERLALLVDGRWEEGAFVDRERAAAIWRGAIVNSSKRKVRPQDDIVWVPGPWKDPALLEWQRGGSFDLRIFPIPARAARSVELAYTQRLAPAGSLRRYSYPLPHAADGSTRIGQFDVDVQVVGHAGPVAQSGLALHAVDTAQASVAEAPRRERFAFSAQDFVPTGDITLEFANQHAELVAYAYSPARPAASGLRSQPRHQLGAGPEDAQSYVAIALRPELPLVQRDAPRHHVFVVDRSRSMYGESYRRATRLVQRLISEMDPRDSVSVLACDSECEPWGEGPKAVSTESAARALAFLERDHPEGASDLIHALTSARRDAERTRDSGSLHLVYVGDGASTVGATTPALVRAEARRALGEGVSLTAITVGSNSDRAALQSAVDATGGVLIPHSPGQTSSEAVYAALGASYGTVLANARVELPVGLTRVAPTNLGSIIAGSEHLVVAAMDGAQTVEGEVRLTGTIAGEPFEQRYPLSLRPTSDPGSAFVERLYASVQIEELQERPESDAKARAIALSERFNVQSRHTSLLVLESPAMFRAFGLDNQRRAALWTGEESASQEFSSSSREESGTAFAELDDVGVGTRAKTSSGSGGLGDLESAPSRDLPSATSPSGAAPKSARRSLSKPSRPPSTPGACGCAPADLLCAMGCVDSRFAPPPPSPPQRRMIPMRRVWESAGTITAFTSNTYPSMDLSLAEANYRAAPDSRAALKALYAAYVSAGQLDSASELAELWSSRDPLDPDALTARADLAAQVGDRALALRILGSVIDVRPSDDRAQFRLARAHRWAGQDERSCRQLLAIAQLRTREPKALGEAIQCLERGGRHTLAGELLSGADPQVARQARLRPSNTPELALSGEFALEATWEGREHDLDLVILHPEGYRVSWLGAPTRSVISATDVGDRQREGLALRGVEPGRYAVEIVRSDDSRAPVHGVVHVRFRDQRQTLPFVLHGARARLALVDVKMRSRLVPLD